MRDPAPFQRLDDREAGLPVDTTLYEDVPHWLVTPLRNWLSGTLNGEGSLARRALLRLKMSSWGDDAQTLVDVEANLLHIVVDAVLQLHPGWEWAPLSQWTSYDRSRDGFQDQLEDLDLLLWDGASKYCVDREKRRLVRRVDATVQNAADLAADVAPPPAADHLREAWAAAYGLNPDPDKAYNEAIRAVEEIACPLVEHRKAENGKATLGTVIGELGKNASHKWELALPDKDGDPQSVEHLVGMMQLLWQGQVSRHGGAPKSRRQGQPEAEAAVHLAALLVQWLSVGVLRPA
ncbi:hypothetical protein [Planosporangium mesophilum]|uniref:Uncharacterized protein n=1 Tax=Planosporangium mesophilum TaxID=689768 RepID=A0A8J3THE3_9ACTN|nr:hypothetical protein [Planosporangium mesophilum]NJC86793.1 hypothetical protein [Planosporangium mesophilum]GII26503.1 hypothetical protein Pme01_61000 [Planosporangium mesophilum]